jgi:hypothetical protein
MVTFGKGGWTWTDLYNMPVFLRKYYMKKMNDVISKENAAAAPNTNQKISRPAIQR